LTFFFLLNIICGSILGQGLIGNVKQNRIVKTLPSSEETLGRTDSSYYEKGYSRVKRGQYSSAIEFFTKDIQVNPVSISSFYYRGACKYELINSSINRIILLNEALEDFQRVISLDTLNYNAYDYSGIVKTMLGDYQSAELDFQIAIKLHPNRQKAYFDRGYLKYLQGDFRKAISDYDTVLIIDNNSKDALINRAYCKLKVEDGNGACDDFINAKVLGDKQHLDFINKNCK